MLRRFALRALALLYCVMACACSDGTGDDATELVSSTRLIPIVSVATSDKGQVRARRWLELSDGKAPSIADTDDFSFSVATTDRAAFIRGRYGFVDQDSDLPETSATFRIRFDGAASGSPLLLFEDTLSSSNSPALVELEVELPGRDPEATGSEDVKLRFDVEFGVDQPTGSRRSAAGWVEPFLEIRETIEVRDNKRPWNVLIITSDTTRQADLGVYGGTAKTPALERLASEGILLTHAYSNAYGTTPSHASLLTGSHAREHGVYDNETILGTESVTLAEVLRLRGYSTAAFVSARPLNHALGLDQGFEVYDDVLAPDPSSGLGTYANAERRADLTTSRFLAWLQSGLSRPFFSWVHYYDPHQPYVPTAATAAEEHAFGIDPDTRSFFLDAKGNPLYLEASELLERPREIVEAVDRAARWRYELEIEFVDSQIARIIAALETLGLYENTLIIFTSDHGEYFLDRDVYAYKHSGLHAEVTRLPLLIKLPESRAAGTRASFLLGNVDIAPTILELLAIAPPEEWTGNSFSRLLGESPNEVFREHVILEGASQHAVSVRNRRWMYQMIAPQFRSREDVYRYLGYEPGSPAELYDLESDPQEQKPISLVGSPVAATLEALLHEFLAQRGGGQGETLVSPEHREALEALGYVTR